MKIKITQPGIGRAENPYYYESDSDSPEMVSNSRWYKFDKDHPELPAFEADGQTELPQGWCGEAELMYGRKAVRDMPWNWFKTECLSFAQFKDNNIALFTCQAYIATLPAPDAVVSKTESTEPDAQVVKAVDWCIICDEDIIDKSFCALCGLNKADDRLPSPQPVESEVPEVNDTNVADLDIWDVNGLFDNTWHEVSGFALADAKKSGFEIRKIEFTKSEIAYAEKIYPIKIAYKSNPPYDCNLKERKAFLTGINHIKRNHVHLSEVVKIIRRYFETESSLQLNDDVEDLLISELTNLTKK